MRDDEVQERLLGDGRVQAQRDELVRENAALREVVEAFVAETVDYMTRNKLGDPEGQHNVRWARAVLGPDVNARGVSEPPLRRAGDTPFCDDEPETVASGRPSKYCRIGECERKERGGTRCKIKAECQPGGPS